MKKAEYIAEAEKRRRRRERELLLLLLLLLEGAYREAILAYRHGLSWPRVLENRITGNPAAGMNGAIPGIQGVLEHTHQSAVELVQAKFGTPPPTMQPDYRPSAVDFATALLISTKDVYWNAINLAPDIETAVKTIRMDLRTAGYTRENPVKLELGIERQVVGAFNEGTIAGIVDSDRITGLQHVSVIDERTTTICLDRDGLKLPLENPYWLTNVPPLHWFCRSVLYPLSGDQEWSNALPTVPAMAGFGAMSPAVAVMVNRANVP